MLKLSLHQAISKVKTTSLKNEFKYFLCDVYTKQLVLLLLCGAYWGFPIFGLTKKITLAFVFAVSWGVCTFSSNVCFFLVTYDKFLHLLLHHVLHQHLLERLEGKQFHIARNCTLAINFCWAQEWIQGEGGKGSKVCQLVTSIFTDIVCIDLYEVLVGKQTLLSFYQQN